MAFGGQQDFLKRLQQFYGDVVMNVVHVFFEREVLDKTTLFLFLDKHKHELFHELIPKISCCECFKSNSIASVSKTGCLDAFQFDLLYDRSACAETNHEIKRGQKFQQYCVCNINPKTVEVADLDIILIRAVIKSCCKRTLPGNPSWLKEIKDVRNYIDHIGNSYRISKSDFEEKWNRLETNTLNIALITGKSFQFMTQKDIHRLKAEHDTIDRIQAVAENTNDSLKEEILNAFKNHPGVTQDEIGQISYQLNQLLFKITDLEVKISTRRNADDLVSEQKDPTKCYVRWTLSTPSSWRVEDIKRKLRSVTELTNFTIEFVYAGSLIIDTSVSLDIITDPEKFCIASLEFLQTFVKACEIDTNDLVIIDVTILASFLPYRGTGKCSFGSCRTCENRNMTTDADKWCKDCQELFCNTCSIFHGAITYSANHNILCLNDSMEHFPPNISQTQTCNEHDRDYLFFCETHHNIVCIECVRLDHSNCGDIVSLTFAALNRTSSFVFENLESSIRELIADIEQVLSDLANFSSSIELKNIQIKTDIAKKFKGIPTGNKIMETTLHDLNSKYEKCISVITKDVNELKTIKLNISEIEIQINQVKEYCSRRQAFICMHNVIKKIRKAEKSYRTYINDMKTVNLHCEPDGQFLVRGYQKEQVKIVYTLKPYIFPSAQKDVNNKQAQVPILREIDNIRLSKKSVFHIGFNRTNFVCLNDKLYIGNTAGKLIVLHIDGSFHEEINLLNAFGSIDDITVINEDQLAVMGRNEIVCVHVKNKVNQRITKIFDRHYSYRRLSCNKEFLFLLTDRLCIIVKDLAGNVVNTIYITDFEYDISAFVADKDKILFLSGCFYTALSCFNLNGRLLWSAKTSEYISEYIWEPLSSIQITVDKWGNCYVPSYDNNVTILSKDGKQSKLLLPDSDTIDNLTGVFFEKTNSRLVVFNDNRLCTVFNVT